MTPVRAADILPGSPMPDYRTHAVDVRAHARGELTRQGDVVLDGFLREVVPVGRADRAAGDDGGPGAVLRVADQRRDARPGPDDAFLDRLLTTRADVVRVYLPPDANCLLAVMDRCLRSPDHVNVVVHGRQALPQWLSVGEAEAHCAAGIGAWDWAGSTGDGEPDVVLACCGDAPTLEVVAAASILREHLPQVRVRVVNVVDLMALQSRADHPHGLSDSEHDALFTPDRPVVLAFHGCPWLIHRLGRRRARRGLHVCGRRENGPVRTPFDGRVRNRWDRFHLVQDVVDRLPEPGVAGARLRRSMGDSLLAHAASVSRYGVDLPQVRTWRWSAG